jgi:hypothetical protein
MGWSSPQQLLHCTNFRNQDVGRVFWKGGPALVSLGLPGGKRRSKKGDQVIEKKAK